MKQLFFKDDYYEAKQHPITKKMVLDAYKKVKSNKGSAGIDDQSLQDFTENLSGNLYKIWNRLTSGSYFPPVVKEVRIPKKDGNSRRLGIPTVSDRIAQQVVKTYLEPKVDIHFHQDSYGYRPQKSSHQALEKAVSRCVYILYAQRLPFYVQLKVVIPLVKCYKLLDIEKYARLKTLSRAQ